MFNVSKKTLSVVLCFVLLASVVAVCFVTPASAEKVTASTTQNVTMYKDLSKELTPDVNLTFDGATPYGIPYCRNGWGSHVSYDNTNGYAKFTVSDSNGTRVFFVGKDGSVGSTVTYTTNNTESDAKAAAVANLYSFEAGKTYSVSFDIKALSGSTAGTYSILCRLATAPQTGGTSEANMTRSAESGKSLVYSGEGDSDWQTYTTTFTAVNAGNLGIAMNKVVNVAIDNIKIYDLTAFNNAQFQNKITFDSGSGFAMNRAGTITYGTEANSNNKFATIAADSGGNKRPVFFAKAEPSTSLNANKSGVTEDEINAAYNNMFKLLPGKTYEISLKYRYDSNLQSSLNSRSLYLIFTENPATFTANSEDELTASGNSWAENVTIVGNKSITDIGLGVWQELKVTLTVKSVEEFTGAYFSLAAHYRTFSVDDYVVREVSNESVSMTSDYVTHDMEGEVEVLYDKATATPGTFVPNGGSGASFVDLGDSHGTVLQFDTTSNRGVFRDTNVFVPGKKYYISFDARLTDANDTTARTMSLWIAPVSYSSATDGSGNDNCRFGFDANSPVKYYVNGVETGFANFKNTGADWQRYGIVVDLTDDAVVSYIKTKSDTAGDYTGDTFFDTAKCFYLGANNSQFDNLTIVATSEVDGAIPETEGDFTNNFALSYRKESGNGESYRSAGVRFKASLSNSLVDSAAEIGFVAAPSSYAAATPDWYMLENGLNPIARQAVVKNVAEDIDIVYGTDTEGYTDYQLVITGLSTADGKTAFNRRYSIVVYAKDADGNYSYSALGEASYYQAIGVSEAQKSLIAQ